MYEHFSFCNKCDIFFIRPLKMGRCHSVDNLNPNLTYPINNLTIVQVRIDLGVNI